MKPDSLKIKRERIENIDELLKGDLTCPVCQQGLVQSTSNDHEFICINDPCIYIDFTISSKYMTDVMSQILPGKRPTDTSWRNMEDAKPKRVIYSSPNIRPYVRFVGSVSIAVLILFAVGFAWGYVENKRIDHRQARLGTVCAIYEKTIVTDVPPLCLEYFAGREQEAE